MIKDIFTKKENQIMIGIIFLSVLLIFIGFYFLDKNSETKSAPRYIPNSKDEIVWQEFESKKYNFSIQYPSHFLLREDDKPFGPVFNIYFDLGENELPLDNFVNTSHISIYPEGITTINSDHYEYFENTVLINLSGEEFNIREYKSIEGDTWAIQAVPKNTPENWLQQGFIWIGSEVKNPEPKCFDGGEEKSWEYCNVLEGDQFYLGGEIDKDFIETGREFLNRIKFQR